MRRTLRLTLLLTATLVLPAGCGSSDSIAAFCAESTAVFAASSPVFLDLSDSCLRARNLELGIGTFSRLASDPGCDAVAKQAAGVVAALKVLSAYFNALNALASFGNAQAAKDASTLTSQAAAALGADSPAQQALASISSFLASAGTGAYQQRSLARDFTQVSSNITSVTGALVEILQRNYIDQELKNEDNKLSSRYKEFGQGHTDPGLALALDDHWQAGERDLDKRRASALSLIAALHVINNATVDLAAHSRFLRTKQIPVLLSPYVKQLQTLEPQIQAAF